MSEQTKSAEELAREARELHIAAEKATQRAQAAAKAEREAARERQRQQDELELNEVRDNHEFASTSENKHWLGLDTSYNGGAEVTIYRWTNSESSANLSRGDLRALRDFLIAQDLG